MSDKMTVAAKGRIRELETELAECRNSRQREHDLRVTLAGELESFKIRYQDEVNARVNAEDELDTVRSGFVAELRKAKAALAETRMAFLHQSELLAQTRHAQAALRGAIVSDWYTLTYKTRDGSFVQCRNLRANGAAHIEQAQRGLGSVQFQLTLQPRHYSQQELDIRGYEKPGHWFDTNTNGFNDGSEA